MITKTEITAKSILTPSKLPGADYVINPYSGCEFGCIYCYADFTRRFTGHMDDEWGDYVDIRVNSPDLLMTELDKLNRNFKIKKTKYKTGKHPVIFLGSVTDPYQDVEIKYQLTRKCLGVILQSGFNGEVSLLTKSPLVIRDIDLFSQFDEISVGMTNTAVDDDVSRLFESSAPPASRRIAALRKLNDAGIKTYAFVGPLIPHFVARESKLRKVFQGIEDSGTKDIWVEHINLSGSKLSRLESLIGEVLGKEIMQEFRDTQNDGNKSELTKLIKAILKDYKLNLVGGDVIDHQKL